MNTQTEGNHLQNEAKYQRDITTHDNYSAINLDTNKKSILQVHYQTRYF